MGSDGTATLFVGIRGPRAHHEASRCSFPALPQLYNNAWERMGTIDDGLAWCVRVHMNQRRLAGTFLCLPPPPLALHRAASSASEHGLNRGAGRGPQSVVADASGFYVYDVTTQARLFGLFSGHTVFDAQWSEDLVAFGTPVTLAVAPRTTFPMHNSWTTSTGTGEVDGGGGFRWHKLNHVHFRLTFGRGGARTQMGLRARGMYGFVRRDCV